MKKPTFYVLAVLFGCSVIAACGPSQAELDARETEVAASIFATQTAAAPTLTLTPSPTTEPIHTPTPTPTPSPTLTPTITPTPTPQITSERGTLIQGEGIISIGIGNTDLSADLYPMFFLGADGWDGFEIELAAEIVQRLFGDQVVINWIPLALDKRFEAVQDGYADFTIFAVTHTRHRESLVSFTSNYYLGSFQGRPDPWGIVVSRTDPVFRGEIDRILLEIIEDGTWRTIYDHWFPDPPLFTIEEMLLEPPWEE
jgi:ABC-type amino acid transport substrate-binding protein